MQIFRTFKNIELIIPKNKKLALGGITESTETLETDLNNLKSIVQDLIEAQMSS
jgi:predicted phosphoribosyltransferase